MDLKIFLPIENYTLTTNLKVEEASKRLSEKIGEKTTLRSFFWGNVTSRPYEGYFVSNSFEIKRSIGYKNSFLPIINGLVYSIAGKTYVKVEMKITPFVLIPTLIAILALTAVSIFVKDFIFSSPFPFLFPLISYLVVYFAFKIESRIAGRFLKRLLEAERINL